MKKMKNNMISISMNENYQNKLDKIAEKMHLSKSELIRRWIDGEYEQLMKLKGCPPNYRNCPYFNTELDSELHCIKDSNVGLCLREIFVD